jgi:hypothetical protein
MSSRECNRISKPPSGLAIFWPLPSRRLARADVTVTAGMLKGAEMRWVAGFLGGILLWPAGGLAECDCPAPNARQEESGFVIWRGAEPIGLGELARLAGPILWYSSDEPLFLNAGAIYPLPDPHPCDPAGGQGIVYYQVKAIVLAGSEHVTLPEQDDPDFMRKVESFVITYYFYYREDLGMDGHIHDIELCKMQILTEQRTGCYEARIKLVVGLGHGVTWYDNILDVTPDSRFPINLFVEEGKHASCPDRNADGIYTPGYDVNRRVNDAWGVRDVLSTGHLIGSGYQASMTKPRYVTMRMMPPESPERCPSLPSRSSSSQESIGAYELRPANTIPLCEAVAWEKEKAPEGESDSLRALREDRARLAQMMKNNKFGDQFEPEQTSARLGELKTSPIESPSMWVPSFSLRHDGLGAVGFTALFRGIDGGLVWAIPKVNLTRENLGLDLLFTPSVSRWADWYITVGSDRVKARTEEIDGEEVETRPVKWDFATEAGYRFRFRVPQKIKPVLLYYDFGGVRLGMRSNGFDDLSRFRLVAEIGAGVF